MYQVEIEVQIARVQTLADGTPRLTFDCREGQVEQAAMLMEYQAQGIAGQLVFIPDIKSNQKESKENGSKF